MLQSDFVLGIGNRWANRHTGSIETYTKGRTFVHVDIEPTQIGRVFNPDFGIVSDAKAALELFVTVAKERQKSGRLKQRQAWPAACQGSSSSISTSSIACPGSARRGRRACWRRWNWGGARCSAKTRSGRRC